MSLAQRAAALAASGLLSACATVPEPIEYYAGVARQVAAQRSALIVSSCAIRDEIGSDLVAVETARLRAQEVATESRSYLLSQGMNLSATPVTMMCAGYIPDKKEDTPRMVADFDRKDATVPGAMPYLYDTANSGNVGLVDDLHRLFDEAYRTANSQIKKAGETPPIVALKLAPDAVARIRQTTGADYLWLASADSLEVSAGKVVGSAVLSAVLTLGMAATAPTGGSMNLVALVDLRTANIVWKKTVGTLGGAATTTATYTGGPQPMMTTNSSGSPGVAADSKRAAALFAPLLSADRVVIGNPPPPVVAAAPPLPTAVTVAQPVPVRVAPVSPPAVAAPVAPAPAVAPVQEVNPAPVVALKPAGSALVRDAALRDAPRPDSAAAGLLAAGTQVEVRATITNANGQWSYISTGGRQGWVTAADLGAQ